MYDATNNRLQTLSKTNGSTKQYRYDANGNMLQAGDNAVTWTAFNQPLDIRNSKTNSLATFRYDANQQRVQQVNGTTGKSETTTYVSKAFEVTHNDVGVNDRVTQYKHHIYAGDEVVAIQIRTLKNGKKAPDETRYLHQDALGNVDTITDSHAKIIQRISYDPFGKRTVTSGSDPDLKAWTARGFTGHEHLDNLGLVHMNARVYDPEIGRFISPDTYIQSPGMSQSYNRYVYVMNNPLRYTDPSGHFFKGLLHAIGKVMNFIMNNLPTIAAIATAILFPASGAMWYVGMVKGAAAGFVGGLLGTGSLEGALQGAFWGGVSGAVAGFIGHGLGAAGATSPFGIAKGVMHGFSQGVIAELRGGSFKSGFIGAIIGGLSPANTMMQYNIGTVFTRTVIASVFGGLAAKASGGSFEDGAIAAAFRHLFNEEVTYFDKKDGVVTRDHRDPRVPGNVARNIQYKIDNQWAENPRNYGSVSGGFNRPWWEQPGNDYSEVMDYAATDAGQRDLAILNSFLGVGGIARSGMSYIGIGWSMQTSDWDGAVVGFMGTYGGLYGAVPAAGYTVFQNHVHPILW